MIPGEYRVKDGRLAINEGRDAVSLIVVNSGDRPVQVGSHYHFYEVNRALQFDRLAAFSMRLNIPAGTAIRFEPGEEKPVLLTKLGGSREVYGLNGLTGGSAQLPEDRSSLLDRLLLWKGGTIHDINDQVAVCRYFRADGRRFCAAGGYGAVGDN